MTIWNKIGIFGKGLMGGSIWKALQGKKDVCFLETLDPLPPLDLLILAVPISVILESIPLLAKHREPLVIIDVGSVKASIVKAFYKATKGGLEFFGTHPMAGKEQNGFHASDPALFEKAPWIVTPHPRNTEKTRKALEELILLLGGRPLIMDADEHDRKAALISQIPYLLSKALFDFATLADPESVQMAGPGFLSMTRLAHDNLSLRKEIGHYNRENIEKYYAQFLEFLKR